MISMVFPIVVFFWIRIPIVGHDNRLLGNDNGLQYIVCFFWLALKVHTQLLQ